MFRYMLSAHICVGNLNDNLIIEIDTRVNLQKRQIMLH